MVLEGVVVCTLMLVGRGVLSPVVWQVCCRVVVLEGVVVLLSVCREMLVGCGVLLLVVWVEGCDVWEVCCGVVV